MLARRSSLTLPDNTPLDLPLLIPSFSSKGFGFSPTGRGDNKRSVSHIALDLYQYSRAPCHAVLISAYDIYFRHFEGQGELRKGPLKWLERARLIFLDSGGYELATDFDTSEPKTPPYAPLKGYGITQYRRVVDSLKDDLLHRSFVITNFDHNSRYKPLQQQVKAARQMFQRLPTQLHSFILKPWARDAPLDPADLSRKDIQSLAGFDMIGVTEKDLGNTLFTRLQRLARLRSALDQAGNDCPIHVWGGLDPVLTPLYFFAGAEIFDGVSWLRYAYINGTAVNRECFSVLADDLIDIQTEPLVCRQILLLKNKGILDKQAGALRQWVDNGGKDFGMFHKQVREQLEAAYTTMLTHIDELKKESRDGR